METNILDNLMMIMWEEGKFFLDAISDHPSTIFAILIIAYFLLQRVVIFFEICCFFFNNKN